MSAPHGTGRTIQVRPVGWQPTRGFVHSAWRVRVAALIGAVALAAPLAVFGGAVSASAATSYVQSAAVSVGNDPTGVAVNATTDTAYVANSSDNTVSVINGATNTVTATVPVGGGKFRPSA